MRASAISRFSRRSAVAACCGVVGDRAGGGVGHVDQLTQGVGVAQRVDHVRVGVVRRPRVMHRDPGEPRQDPDRVHRLRAAFRVHCQEHVRGGGRGVQPGQAAGDPHPGLVEVRRPARR